MADHLQERDEKALAQRLKQEAESTWPEFSESLHCRIVEAVAQEQAGSGAVSAVRSSNRGPRLAVAAALAAAVLILISIVSWWPHFTEAPADGIARGSLEISSGHPPTPSQPLILDPSILADAHINLVIGMGEPLEWLVAPTHDENRWGYLDHDARVAVELVTAQLPLDMFEREED